MKLRERKKGQLSIRSFEREHHYSLEKPELILGILEVNEDDTVDEELSNALVAPILGALQNDSELVSQEVEAFVLGLEAVPALESTEKELDSIGKEGVLEIVLEDAHEDLLVGGADESLEDHDDGDHVLGLAPTEAKGRSAGGEVVEGVGLRSLIGANRADGDSEGSVGGATVAEGGTDDGGDVVATGNDEEANETLVAVDDEVAAHLLGFLVVLDEARWRQAFEVAASRLWLRRGQWCT
jgi:hypothetical protein